MNENEFKGNNVFLASYISRCSLIVIVVVLPNEEDLVGFILYSKWAVIRRKKANKGKEE